MFVTLLRRDLSLIARSPALWLPVMFFVLAAALFPFAVGPDARLLARIAPGIIWVSALLASLLPVETLLAPDVEDGSIDQLIARGIALELVCAARIIAHWIGFAVPLLAALPVAGVLLGLSSDDGTRIAIALALGTPALASLAVVAAALTAGLKGGGALAGLIVLPLALPVLIFGVGSDVAGAFRLLAAASLVALAVGPFAAAAALRPE
ncbi:heme exporter protein CcmB [Sandarakinorhabdus limnophila]|jgi:heme exporter protein B|uniref:heme exporter protein CcmB n=1 Tax=Sandarakinorhabdus limnophila TaxID=210512 RepID=UPI0026F058F6|nr:heme exporter protein CcmB [Sandarakinorhabdus limnophila]